MVIEFNLRLSQIFKFHKIINNLSRLIIIPACLLALTIPKGCSRLYYFYSKKSSNFCTVFLQVWCCLVAAMPSSPFCLKRFSVFTVYSLIFLFHLVLRNCSPSQPFTCYFNQSSLSLPGYQKYHTSQIIQSTHLLDLVLPLPSALELFTTCSCVSDLSAPSSNCLLALFYWHDVDLIPFSALTHDLHPKRAFW